MKKLISLVIAIACISNIKAQYVADALRYSQNFPTLSARSVSMGGAFTSLGGDFSSSYINPAGLGLYRKSEFVFSPGIGYANTSAEYMGLKNTDFKYQFIMSNMGYVGTYNSNRETGLVSASFAIGYNRLNNFNNRTYIRGDNYETSLIDNFMSGINGTDPEVLDAFTQRLAFDAYLIDTVPGTNYEYTTPVLLPVDQRRIIDSRGGTGQWNISFGLNFSNIWYVGMSLAYYQLNYEQKMTHSEFDIASSNYDFFNYTEDLDVEGSGVNLTFGSMVRLFKIMRLGASLHLPTYYWIDEVYRNSMYSVFDNGYIPTDDLGDIYAEGTFQYKLRTPLQFDGGASVQIGKVGIISADIEYIDYANMKLRERDDFTDFSATNELMQNIYRSVVNFKAGGEARFNNLFVRAGGGFYPSPYASWLNMDQAKHTEITAGFGYRSSAFFFDLGFSALLHKEDYDLYSANNGVENVTYFSTLNQQKYRFIASLGFRF
jgi:hypothetical protein